MAEDKNVKCTWRIRKWGVLACAVVCAAAFARPAAGSLLNIDTPFDGSPFLVTDIGGIFAGPFREQDPTWALGTGSDPGRAFGIALLGIEERFENVFVFGVLEINVYNHAEPPPPSRNQFALGFRATGPYPEGWIPAGAAVIPAYRFRLLYDGFILALRNQTVVVRYNRIWIPNIFGFFNPPPEPMEPLFPIEPMEPREPFEPLPPMEPLGPVEPVNPPPPIPEPGTLTLFGIGLATLAGRAIRRRAA